MIGLYMSSTYPNGELEGTLLTQEQVGEISDRISKNVTDEISRQLKTAIRKAEQVKWSLISNNKAKQRKSNTE